MATSELRHLHQGPAPDAGRLRAWVERLAVPRHVFANARGNRWVRDELAAEFERSGLCVRLQGRYQNVVALPMRRAGKPVTLVAAHYDSVPDCPGADDNASGLAVMLECARVLREAADQPIGFVAFNAEEDGLLGSREFLNDGLAELGVEGRVAHVLEMVGFRCSTAQQQLPIPWAPASLRVPDFIGMVSNGASNATVDRAVRSRAGPGLRLVAATTHSSPELVGLGAAPPGLPRSDPQRSLPLLERWASRRALDGHREFPEPELSPSDRHARHARLRVHARGRGAHLCACERMTPAARP